MLALAVHAASTGAPLLDRPPEEHLEHEIKAAFLYQFGAYVDWPHGTFPGEKDPLLIGVMDAEHLMDPLKGIIANRTVRGHPVRMRELRAGDDPRGVHILFIGRDADADAARAALERVRGHPVLTIGEAQNIRDAIIGFVVDEDRVRFDVSLSQAEHSGLRISSRLLSVARRVKEAAP